MKYQPNTPPSLRGVSFVTRRAERIGVVGRTGAGKSSIGMALFRMVELERQNGGVITIDGYNTSDIGLDTLRHAIRYPPRARVGQLVLEGTAHRPPRVVVPRPDCSIIPQHPQLFFGTIRSNLDPFKEYSSDAPLLDALRRAHLEETVAEAGGLDAPVMENGENFSVGQRYEQTAPDDLMH